MVRRVLGFEVTSKDSWDGGSGAFLRHAVSGIEIGLIEHGQNPGSSFNEFHSGLDHLEFRVPDSATLRAWVERLDALGIPRSEVKKGRIVTFRDPDNMQLEFFLDEHDDAP